MEVSSVLLLALVVWGILSFVFGVFIGRVIAFGNPNELEQPLHGKYFGFRGGLPSASGYPGIIHSSGRPVKIEDYQLNEVFQSGRVRGSISRL